MVTVMRTKPKFLTMAYNTMVLNRGSINSLREIFGGIFLAVTITKGLLLTFSGQGPKCPRMCGKSHIVVYPFFFFYHVRPSTLLPDNHVSKIAVYNELRPEPSPFYI